MAAVLLQPSLRIAGPLRDHLTGYDRTQPPAKQQTRTVDDSSNDELQTFVDAMRVREEVFVHEQKVPLENEFDEDDPHCVHIVLYNTRDDGGNPCGTIRIVPASSIIHEHLDKHRTINGKPYHGPVRSSVHDGVERYIKLGRLAVTSSQRGHGCAAILVRAAFDYAATYPDRLDDDFASERHQSLNSKSGQASTWRGLVLIHAQQQVQHFWAKHGFELDKEFGIWDEEGIDHVAMWKRLT